MKKKEQLMWAWKWKGCRAVDPNSLSYKKGDVKTYYDRFFWSQGKIVRVALREVTS